MGEISQGQNNTILYDKRKPPQMMLHLWVETISVPLLLLHIQNANYSRKYKVMSLLLMHSVFTTGSINVFSVFLWLDRQQSATVIA